MATSDATPEIPSARWQRGSTLRSRRHHHLTAAAEYGQLVAQAWRELDPGHLMDLEELRICTDDSEGTDSGDEEWLPGETESSEEDDEEEEEDRPLS